MNRIWREANLMSTILETIYLRYERSGLERDETALYLMWTLRSEFSLVPA